MKGMTFIPRSELNVREIFAQRAEHLGYRIVESRAAFPDYLLEHEGQRIFAEAEFRTSDFLRHRHDLARCDLIVVWEHDLPTMPMPVLELKTNGLHIARRRGRPPGIKSLSPRQLHRRRAFWARRTAAKTSRGTGPSDKATDDPQDRSKPD
jgi:hypothetical protein